jgi:multicomponent Na+:H+ antiporter subunit E
MIALTWNIVLALIWVSLSGHFTAINLFIGFVLGYLILAYALRDLPAFANYAGKGPRFVRFVGFFIVELVKSNLRVAHDVLTPTHHMRPAVIAFPLDSPERRRDHHPGQPHLAHARHAEPRRLQ